MARIAAAPTQDMPEDVALALGYTRAGLAQLTGRETERGLEPLELYAHVPGLFRGIGTLEQATAALDRVDRRLQALAQLKAATLTNCEYCIDLGSQISRRWGLTDEELLALRKFSSAIRCVSSTSWASSKCVRSLAKRASGTSTGVRLIPTA